MQVEALHDKPVAVSSLMEKFPLDFGIIVHACCANMGGGEGGRGEYCHTYIQSCFLFGLYRYDRCEGYGFQAVYSGIGYINHRVSV